MARPRNDDPAEDAKKIVDDAKNFIEKAIADIGQTSATKQLILGTASGWYVKSECTTRIYFTIHKCMFVQAYKSTMIFIIKLIQVDDDFTFLFTLSYKEDPPCEIFFIKVIEHTRSQSDLIMITIIKRYER